MKRSNDFLVGAVVLIVSGALIAAVLWIQQADVGQREQHVVARFRDIGNARVGNAAVIRGVRGGHIDALELAPNGWVHVRMSVDRDVRLPQDPVVLLNESSLFGEWQATIAERSSIPHDETVRLQITEASGAGDVLPGATLPGIGKLTAVAGQIAGDVASVAGRVEVAFDEQAAREVRGSIRNVSEFSTILSRTVRAHASDLDSLSNQLRTAVVSLNATAASAQRFSSRLDSSASGGEIKRMVDDAAHAAVQLREASTQIHDLSVQLSKSQTRLDTFLANGDSVMKKINSGQGSLALLLNDPSIYRRSDSLLVELRGLIADIKANPKKYVSVHVF
jgi:phospholipid/cholesterol/gamma-HCH transport system substrate-binding protein